MKFKANKNELLKLVSKAQNVIEKRNTMPILTNILLEATDNTLTLYATDLEVSVKATCPIVSEQTGKVVVGAKNIFDILKELPEGEISIKTSENNSITIEQGKSYFHINGLNPDEFPVFPTVTNEHYHKISPDVIKEMIDKTIYSVSTDESRYHLNGVFFETENNDKNNFRMVATDGHRLSLVDRKLSDDLSKSLKSGIIVPRKGLNEVKKIIESLDSDKDVEISVEGAQLVLRSDDTLLMIRLIEGKYPNYRNLLPKDLFLHAIIDKEKFISSLKRVSLVSNQKSKGVTFSISKGSMEIFSNSPDLGEAKEELEIEYDKENLKIGFNARYILDALNTIEEDEIKISFKDQNSPVLLGPKNDQDYQCVVMPMRI